MQAKGDPDTPLPLVAGLKVGPWVLGRLLGTGSFGQVWSAHTPASTKEPGPWALKLSQLYEAKDLARRKRNPRAKIQQTQAAQRLFNEYQITALRLRAKMTTEPLAMRCLAFPPNAGATGKGAGYRYLAMRDAGSDLAIVTAALNAYRLPIGAVCAIGVDMVDALRLMHQRASVLHLDLKPDNICISRPAVPDPAVPACATLIDFTTCMPVRDYKGERQPVSTLGVTSFSSLRMEAEPDGGLVQVMDLEGLAIVLAALAGCPAPWFGPEPERERRRKLFATAQKAIANSGAPKLPPAEAKAAADLAKWSMGLPKPLGRTMALCVSMPADAADDDYAAMKRLLTTYADRRELLRVIEAFEGQRAGKARHADLLAFRGPGTRLAPDDVIKAVEQEPSREQSGVQPDSTKQQGQYPGIPPSLKGKFGFQLAVSESVRCRHRHQPG